MKLEFNTIIYETLTLVAHKFIDEEKELFELHQYDFTFTITIWILILLLKMSRYRLGLRIIINPLLFVFKGEFV